MTHRDFIAVGASAGGVDALRDLASRFPPDLPATVAIVLHVGPHESLLPSLLSAAGPLEARHAEDGQIYARGKIYVAPPDRHLIVDGTRLRLVHGAKENFARPAIDPLFRSTALEMGPRAIGVVLTGLLDDGAAGLEAIQACGGATLVQDPADAFARDMPLNASPFADYILPVAGLAARLVQLVGGTPPAPGKTESACHATAHRRITTEQHAWIGDRSPVEALRELGVPSMFTCPDCNGSLWQVNGSRLLRYRCHTGHAYTTGSLASGREDDVERSMMDAMRALQEREMACRARGEFFGKQGDTAAQTREEEIARRANEAAGLLQSLLLER
ncbi:chemotaxis protein CheB [Paraburkholderia phymatum]|uniref:protein-glutamate methylesterase n=1 Tax=Paraburkholderia phymatum (strain DSM 17167 / CIP 108236 / LMG 21445 / STM815) TaxID=391038 RepID=B2JWV1_PARP8|nr:chemotaxis protein CheB [Paraburkholderia phymatum]ACC75428.1 CheB methylesterase [Paraburkholderia phymatum STM815]